MKTVSIVGGGAAGMVCAILLARKGVPTVILERGERLGRKLSASGNGQGNVTNLHMGAEHYFSDDNEKVARLLSRFGAGDAISFWEELGGAFLPDSRGRVYPAGRQASAVTDLLRRELTRLSVKIIFGAQVKKITYRRDFLLEWEGRQLCSDAVVLAAGGKAAPNFGTDGSAYVLAESFGHTVAPCFPVLVQLRSDPAAVRGLKGIRTDSIVRVFRGKLLYETRGDVLFTESGVSGDAIFRASSYAQKGDEIMLDLLPDVDEKRIFAAMEKGDGEDGLLCLVNNGLGRALYRRANGDKEALLRLLKSFPLTVTGTLGFPYAQVTRGGVLLKETDEHLMSVRRAGLFFAGEILNVDGECGGYNLQWAFTSACAAAEGVLSWS